MHPYPHTYTAAATADPAGLVAVSSPGLQTVSTAPPAEFEGPGDRWSPETLLVASIADCFVLTFRAVSRAARFRWLRIECRVEGVLERIEGVPRFSRFTVRPTLTVAGSADQSIASELLKKTERGCLISNSLSGARALEADIRVYEGAAA